MALTIRQIARSTGISAGTIRFHETVKINGTHLTPEWFAWRG